MRHKERERESSDPVAEEFGRFLRERFPDAKIEYEPQTFMSTRDEDGLPEGTTPDWRIEFPNGRIVFAEVTSAEKNGTDPKEKQKRVMKRSAPGIYYFVFYRQQLKLLQTKERYRKHDLNFPFPKLSH